MKSSCMGALACIPCNYVIQQASVLRDLWRGKHTSTQVWCPGPGYLSRFLYLYLLIMDSITIMIKNRWQEYSVQKGP